MRRDIVVAALAVVAAGVPAVALAQQQDEPAAEPECRLEMKDPKLDAPYDASGGWVAKDC